MTIVSYIVAFVYSWKLSLVLSAVVPIYVIVGNYYSQEMIKGFELNRSEYEKAGGLAEEIIYNIKTVFSFGNMEKEVQTFDKILLFICIPF